MSNYVWSKIICKQEVFDKIVMDNPRYPSHSIISFHNILGVDYDDREARNVLVVKNADDTYELKYCQRWFYPITCITDYFALRKAANRLKESASTRRGKQ